VPLPTLNSLGKIFPFVAIELAHLHLVVKSNVGFVFLLEESSLICDTTDAFFNGVVGEGGAKLN